MGREGYPRLTGGLLVFGGLGYCVWDAFQPHPMIELRADSWGCTASHPETSTTYIMAGKVMVPITTTSQVCDRYERRA